MATLGKTCILTPDSLVPPDPTLQKESFCAIPSSVDHTAIPRHSQECHFVPSMLLPALEKARAYQTCTRQTGKPTHTFPRNTWLRYMVYTLSSMRCCALILLSNLCPFRNKEEMVSHHCEVTHLSDPGCHFCPKEQVRNNQHTKA